MRRARSLAFALACAALAAAPAAHAQEIKVLPDREQLFIVPEGKQGCWVSFFEGKDFRPPGVQVTGRTFIESFEPKAQATVEPPLEEAGGAQALRRAQSMVVGPHARLEGYDEERFSGGRTLELGPGERVRDLDALRFHERVHSLKVFCEE